MRKYLLQSLLFLPLLWPAVPTNHAQANLSTKPSGRKFKHNSKVESLYDKGKDQTTTYLRPMTLRYEKSSIEAKVMSDGRVDYLPSEVLSITAYFNSPGKVLLKPQFVVIGFRSLTLDKTPYTNDLSLAAKVDGSMIALGSMTIMDQHIDEGLSAGSNRYIVQALELPIPFETFLRVTESKHATMVLAGREVKLQSEHLEAFRDLVSRVN